MQTLTITDEDFGGKMISEIEIKIKNENTTVKEIIEARVTAEVDKYNESETHMNKVFLPFEGDNGLSLVLSKAFLLAEDDKITDTTILSQLR